MGYKPKNTISDIIQDSHPFREFLSKVKKLSQINEVVVNQLTKLNNGLNNQIQVANFNKGVLTLITDSPNIAHQLRFEKGSLLASFRGDPLLYGLSSIKIIVSVPDLYSRVLPDLPTPNISKHCAKGILQMSGSIKSKALKEALVKLSENGK